MARKSLIARDEKRKQLILKYAKKRAELKAKGDYEALAQLPKNSNPIRLRRRCRLSGRPRGYMSQFGVSRIEFRDLASRGEIMGIKKSSW